MKKIFSLILLSMIFILISCSSKYSNEKSIINKISIDNYLDEIVEDNVTKKYYISRNTNRIYLYYKTEDEYKMIINESFYSLGMSDFIKTDNLDDYKNLHLNINSEVIRYKIKDKKLIDEEEIDIYLTEDEFFDYVKEVFNDEFNCPKDDLYEIINYVSKKTDFSSFLLLSNHNPSMYYVHGKVSWFEMNKNNTFFHLINDKLDDTKKKRLSNFMYNVCISEFGAPGYLDYTFYLSSDKKNILPYMVLKYESSALGTIYFYNLPLMEDVAKAAES